MKTNSEGIVFGPQGDTCEGFSFSPLVVSHPLSTNSFVQVTVTNCFLNVVDTILPSTTPSLNISNECELVGINENCNCCKSSLVEPIVFSNMGNMFHIKYFLPTDAYE